MSPASGQGASEVKGVRVLVTRPAQDADAWVAPLRQAGFDAEALPLIDIAAASAPGSGQALAQAWASLHSYAACFFVSGNAVEHFFKPKLPLADVSRSLDAIKIIATDRQPVAACWPPVLRCMAPGPGTARALRLAGVPAAQIDTPPPHASQFDSQALWHQLDARDWRGQRVLIVRGASSECAALLPVAGACVSSAAAAPGRDWIARQWLQAGAAVDFLVVYERSAPRWSAAQCSRARAACADGSVWLLSSSEAADHLMALPALAGADWQHARAVATHPRIAERLNAVGWGVVCTSRPTLADIMRSIESMGHE